MVSTTPNKKTKPSSPAKPIAKSTKPGVASPARKSPTPSRRPQRAARAAAKAEEDSDTAVPDHPAKSRSRSLFAGDGGGSSAAAATSPRGTPRRGAADKARKEMKKMTDDDATADADDDDDTFDAKMEPAEDEAMDKFDDSPKKKARSKPGTPRGR
jgi:hypothetical protein